jgi:hypothetical protein
MGSRRAGVFLIAALVALSGCGGGDKKDDGGGASTTPSDAATTPAATGQGDAQAKVGARTLVTYVEACYVDSMDYSTCKDPAAGEDVAAATVDSATATTYVIVSPSDSGNEFRIEKGEDGSTTQTCDTAGEGDCGPDGTW